MKIKDFGRPVSGISQIKKKFHVEYGELGAPENPLWSFFFFFSLPVTKSDLVKLSFKILSTRKEVERT